MRILPKFLRRKTLSPEDTDNIASRPDTRHSSRRTKSLSTTRKSNNSSRGDNNDRENFNNETNNNQQQNSATKPIMRRQKGPSFAGGPWPRSTPLHSKKPVTRSSRSWSTAGGGSSSENYVNAPSPSPPAPPKNSILPDSGLFPGSSVKIIGGTHKNKTGVLVKRAVVRGTVELDDGPAADVLRKIVTVALHNIRHRDVSIVNQATATEQSDANMNNNDKSDHERAYTEEDDSTIEAETAALLSHGNVSSEVPPNEVFHRVKKPNPMPVSLRSEDDDDNGPCQQEDSPSGPSTVERVEVSTDSQQLEAVEASSQQKMNVKFQQQDSPSRPSAVPLSEDIKNSSDSRHLEVAELSSPKKEDTAESTICSSQVEKTNDNAALSSPQPNQLSHSPSADRSFSDDDGDGDGDGGSTQGTLLLLSPVIPSSAAAQDTSDKTDLVAMTTKLPPAIHTSHKESSDVSVDDATSKSMGEEDGHESDGSSTTLDPDAMLYTQTGEHDDLEGIHYLPSSPISAQANQSFESTASSLNGSEYGSSSIVSHKNSADGRTSPPTTPPAPVITRLTDIFIHRSSMDLEVNSSIKSLEDTDNLDIEKGGSSDSLLVSRNSSLKERTRNKDCIRDDFNDDENSVAEHLADTIGGEDGKQEEQAEAFIPPHNSIPENNSTLDTNVSSLPLSTAAPSTCTEDKNKHAPRPCWGDWNEETDDEKEEEEATTPPSLPTARTPRPCWCDWNEETDDDDEEATTLPSLPTVSIDDSQPPTAANDQIVDIIGGKHEGKTAIFVKRTPQCVAVMLEGKNKPVYLAPKNVSFRDGRTEGCAYNIPNPRPPPTEYDNWAAGARVTIIGGTHIRKTGTFVKKTPHRIAVRLDEARSVNSKPVYLKPIYVQLKST